MNIASFVLPSNLMHACRPYVGAFMRQACDPLNNPRPKIACLLAVVFTFMREMRIKRRM